MKYIKIIFINIVLLLLAGKATTIGGAFLLSSYVYLLEFKKRYFISAAFFTLIV